MVSLVLVVHLLILLKLRIWIPVIVGNFGWSSLELLISASLLLISKRIPMGNIVYMNPSFNLSLPFVLPFRFGKTSDSTMVYGASLLNAMKVNRYVKRTDGSFIRTSYFQFSLALLFCQLDKQRW